MGSLIPYKTLTKLWMLSLFYTGFACSPAFADSPRTTTIIPDSVNLSAADFLPEFISQSAERRAAARLYLLGVLDSTEGKTWCSYSQIKTVTINEFVFEYLQKQSAEKLKVRASALIEAALKHHLPCKNGKSIHQPNA